MDRDAEGLWDRMPPETVRLLSRIGQMASGSGEAAYLVGGAVRDLLLGKAGLDLDIVVEGRAISLAGRIAEAQGVPFKKHPRFGTATIQLDTVRLDLATARSEVYPHPGALPQVSKGTILQDLARRDFSINAMALRLDPDRFGQIMDPHDGRQDLQQGLIRMLHQGSFIDDPTRIFRAIRYEQRLGFHLETETEALLKQGLPNLDTISPQRRWHELDLMLAEPAAEKMFLRADQTGLLGKLSRVLAFDELQAKRFARARAAVDETFCLTGVYLALLSFGWSGQDAERCISDLQIPGQAARIICDAPRLREKMPQLAPLELQPSRIVDILKGHIPEAIKAAAIISEPHLIRERLNLYLDHLRYIKPSLAGEDLQRLGVPSGRRMGRMLRMLHQAVLDDEVQGRAQEEIFIRALLASE